MKINSHVSTIFQLEKDLKHNSMNMSKGEQNLDNEEEAENQDATQEMAEQIQIPLAYSINANVISVQTTTSATLLDIKV